MVVDRQIAEGAHPEIGQLGANPVVRVIAFVDSGFAQHTPRGAEQWDAGDARRVEEFPVRQRHGELLDLLGGQFVGAGRQDCADDRAGRGAGDPLDRVPGFQQRHSRAGQADALDAATREDQVRLQFGGFGVTPEL